MHQSPCLAGTICTIRDSTVGSSSYEHRFALSPIKTTTYLSKKLCSLSTSCRRVVTRLMRASRRVSSSWPRGRPGARRRRGTCSRSNPCTRHGQERESGEYWRLCLCQRDAASAIVWSCARATQRYGCRAAPAVCASLVQIAGKNKRERGASAHQQSRKMRTTARTMITASK